MAPLSDHSIVYLDGGRGQWIIDHPHVYFSDPGRANASVVYELMKNEKVDVSRLARTYWIGAMP